MEDASDRQDLELARQAVRAAGAVVMEHFRQGDPVRYKSPDQPVTDADVRADVLLRELLTGERPDYGWLSEETADSRARLERSRVWVVDPIDGTNSFVEGRPEFVVSVGLAVRGEVRVGVVHNPATGELYQAVRGQGASRDGTSIRVAPPPTRGERGILLASRTDLRRGLLDAYRDEWALVPLGSTAYRMVKVADGTGHLCVSRALRSEWDVCAAALIVSEAGGHVAQADGRPLRYNQPSPIVRGIIASSQPSITLPPDAEAIAERTRET